MNNSGVGCHDKASFLVLLPCWLTFRPNCTLRRAPYHNLRYGANRRLFRRYPFIDDLYCIAGKDLEKGKDKKDVI